MKCHVLPGADSRESYTNMLDWLDRVARDFGLPCDAFPADLNNNTIKGVYHKLRQDEVDNFLGKIQRKLMEWGAECITNRMSAGHALKVNPSGKGQLSFQPIQIGSFLCCTN